MTEQNPNLPEVAAVGKSTLNNLLKIFIFVLLAGGGLLFTLKQIEGYYRYQLYMSTEAALPVHKQVNQKISESDNQKISETEGWQIYRNEEYGFEFKYPKYFGLIVAENSEPPTGTFYAKTSSKKYGKISIFISDQQLDPNNIEGIYEKIENPAKITFSNTEFYRYLEGEVFCGSLSNLTALNRKTLNLNFGYCEGDLGPVLYADTDLVNKILSTFTFIDLKK